MPARHAVQDHDRFVGRGEVTAVQAIADYTLLRSLGGGSQGEFFLAEPPNRLGVDSDYVAVKVMAGPTTDVAFRRATRELRIFATVDSPYLVDLLDAGQDGDRFFYSMEYMPLGSLATPAGPLTRDEKLLAVADAARAAHALHENGVVHRGIKPANILLHEHGARLSDLGLAQLMTPGLTMTGLGAATSVEYVDPALLRGEQPSRATDIWSLGVTLHRVLTDESVYGDMIGADSLLAIRKVLTTAPVLSQGLSPADAAAVRACIEPEPGARPPTARALAEAIDVLDR
jgi:serine/threonine protein kinase